jgi:transposase
MVTKRTVHRPVKQYETGDLIPKKMGTQKTSLLEDHKDTIVGFVEQHPDWTLWQSCDAVEAQTGIVVSTGTMCRFLAKHELTLKRDFSQPKSYQ